MKAEKFIPGFTGRLLRKEFYLIKTEKPEIPETGSLEFQGALPSPFLLRRRQRFQVTLPITSAGSSERERYRARKFILKLSGKLPRRRSETTKKSATETTKKKVSRRQRFSPDSNRSVSHFQKKKPAGRVWILY